MFDQVTTGLLASDRGYECPRSRNLNSVDDNSAAHYVPELIDNLAAITKPGIPGHDNAKVELDHEQQRTRLS